MQLLVNISRIFVGVLFIISGFIKLNDPLGFSFKLEEYFSASVLNLEFLTPLALAIAIFVVIFEVLLGVFLLLGFKVKFTVWSLLVMIVFFTFLTFYSAVTGKVTDCGCFGDALKLTPWQSFFKDVVLLLFILLLFLKKEYIFPLSTKKNRLIGSGIALLLCIFYTVFVLRHLPAIDFRPYKVGANIMEGMTIPDDAPKPVYEYAWLFKVNGKEQTIKTLGDYPSVDGEFIGVETKEVQKGYEPPIHDYTMERDGVDYTEKIMNSDNVIIVIARDIDKADEEGLKDIKTITDEALKKGYQVFGMSASSVEEIRPVKQKIGLNFDFYFCDLTTLKTIVRSNPGILKLKNGTIMQKLHYNDADELKL
ncbi:BT_3928 family protein [Abyssalbus ytuae]|uniref:DoxX family membrane protein n=1 Tax=Abyssalbus ytuae TaxID=2926907 RepID=A0A9E6ZTS8_9FLAO|nr:BT_3928 family protein [Abyssalbus ytuae]UOB16561.1 DoxX family membrane protein [Abyssalbus ytuae]